MAFSGGHGLESVRLSSFCEWLFQLLPLLVCDKIVIDLVRQRGTEIPHLLSLLPIRKS